MKFARWGETQDIIVSAIGARKIDIHRLQFAALWHSCSLHLKMLFRFATYFIAFAFLLPRLLLSACFNMSTLREQDISVLVVNGWRKNLVILLLSFNMCFLAIIVYFKYNTPNCQVPSRENLSSPWRN